MNRKWKEWLLKAAVLLAIVGVGLWYELYWQLLGALAGLAVFWVRRSARK